MKVSIITDRIIGTAWNQEIRNKTSTKTSSIAEAMEISELNTSINLTKGIKMLMFNEKSS